MSLQRLAHRIATVKALAGRTLAGDRVRDSAIAPIDVQAGEEAAPFIAVYTDDFEGRWRDLPGRDDQTLALILEIGVTARMLIADPDNPGNEIVSWGIPPTDAGIELTLDMIERQARIALDDEANAWAELWRTLHMGDAAYTSIRGASAEKGIRFAGRQLKVEVQPLDEPAFGPAASGVWSALLDAMDADAELVNLAPAVRSLIEADTPPVDWIAVRRRFGMDDGEVTSLGLEPAEGAGEETTFADHGEDPMQDTEPTQ